MDAVELLRNRIAAAGVMSRERMSAARELDWARPLLPGTSPLGLTLWHMPRTVDWLINTALLARPEVADDKAFADLPGPDRFGFGTGLTPDEATEAAAQVLPEALLAYSEAVHAMADDWLGSLPPEGLDAAVPEFLERQQSRPAYATEPALNEVRGLVGKPVGILLARPTMSHLLMHLGETDLIVQLATR